MTESTVTAADPDLTVAPVAPLGPIAQRAQAPATLELPPRRSG
jgi:hypothetical protein